MCVCVCARTRVCVQVTFKEYTFCFYFAGKPEKDGDVSANRPRRRRPDAEESVSGDSQDGAVALKSRGLARSKGSPHTAELINGGSKDLRSI